MSRFHAIVSGRVQGVSFRYSTVEEARRLGLRGWVRNRREGTVEVLAEGDQASLERLAAWLEHGPPGARVSRVALEWRDRQGAGDGGDGGEGGAALPAFHVEQTA